MGAIAPKQQIGRDEEAIGSALFVPCGNLIETIVSIAETDDRVDLDVFLRFRTGTSDPKVCVLLYFFHPLRRSRPYVVVRLTA